MYRFEDMSTIDKQLFQHQNYFLVVIKMPNGEQALDLATFEMITEPARIYLKSDGTVFEKILSGWFNYSDIGTREIQYWSDVLSLQDFKFKDLLQKNKTLEAAYNTFVELYEIITGYKYDQRVNNNNDKHQSTPKRL